MLQLHRAEKRREAKTKIGMILRALDFADRVVVLEDLLADAEQTASDHLPQMRFPATEVQTLTPVVVTASEESEEKAIWMRIYSYCKAQPRPDAIFTAKEVAQALHLHEDSARAATYIMNAVQRRAVNGPRGDKIRDPKFVWLGQGAGKFRLLEPAATP
jgi:hypothetical protein